MSANVSQTHAERSRCNYDSVFHQQPQSTVGKTLALALIDAVHSGDELTVRRILDRPDLARIAVDVALHAQPKRRLAPCGTRSAAERHVARGEPLDPACDQARKTYYRNRQREARSNDRQLPLTNVVEGDGINASGADIDPVAIDRYLAGDPTVRLTRAEKHEVYQRLRASGHSLTAAAARLRLSGSTARDYEAAMVAIDTHTAASDDTQAGVA